VSELHWRLKSLLHRQNLPSQIAETLVFYVVVGMGMESAVDELLKLNFYDFKQGAIGAILIKLDYSL
jgi:hypothetical protein